LIQTRNDQPPAAQACKCTLPSFLESPLSVTTYCASVFRSPAPQSAVRFTPHYLLFQVWMRLNLASNILTSEPAAQPWHVGRRFPS